MSVAGSEQVNFSNEDSAVRDSSPGAQDVVSN